MTNFTPAERELLWAFLQQTQRKWMHTPSASKCELLHAKLEALMHQAEDIQCQFSVNGSAWSPVRKRRASMITRRDMRAKNEAEGEKAT